MAKDMIIQRSELREIKRTTMHLIDDIRGQLEKFKLAHLDQDVSNCGLNIIQNINELERVLHQAEAEQFKRETV